ncbi:hypothetical protein B296_00019493 [Ensete ventricosum]|uniref:Uncharacterized protein n=1 Tax=Ensete ventricosum TaxID=4639 RepID=A0A427B2K0_ENSVE|nr:hypothetical protein B296_00019493 [Ensete ventricosum]
MAGGNGGGGHGVHHGGVEDFRNKVWSMTGGPYCRPKHWKRNTAIAMFGVFLVCIPIAMKSAELEVGILFMFPPHVSWLASSVFFHLIRSRIMSLHLVFILQQRPHYPVRPIPSQLWCKNFGKKEY